MIPLPCRQKGGGLQLGARRPGEDGPFGIRPGLEDADPDEDNDGQDDEQDDEGRSAPPVSVTAPRR